MRIALCADAVIPPPRYGGTERFVAWLARGLHALGHEVTLVAREGSHVPEARFAPYRASSTWEDSTPRECEILHLMGPANPYPRRPYVVTIQGNGQPGEIFDRRSIFVSRRHAENHGWTAYVHNGLDPADYPMDLERGNSLVFLAKASWKVKNLEGALEVARQAGLPIDILGSRSLPFGLHRWLTSFSRLRGVRYHGMVGDAEKTVVLRRARALVFPVRWHEPFGIAITEALASGCAVLGTPYGSLPEIISPDVGVLAADVATLAQAAREASKRFRPETCRARVLNGFTHLDAARSFVKHYESVLSTGHLHGIDPAAPPPRAPETFEAQALLPWRSGH